MTDDRTLKIHFSYRHIDRPWGGANNFTRALRAELSAHGGFVFTESIEEDCDILFMNQLGAGPGGDGKRWPLSLVRRLTGKRLFGLPPRQSHRKLAVRAINLSKHAFPMGPRNFTVGRINDWKVLALLNMADLAIFQSHYQRKFFMDAGYGGKNSVVIYNGADRMFWTDQPAYPRLESNLRLISSTASPRATKRHELIARVSLLEGIEVRHYGQWPTDVDHGRVELLGTQPQDRIITAMSDSHYFLHTAIKDPCPNVLFEAMCLGLPVIYNPGPGSSEEIVQDCGIALDEYNLNNTMERARKMLGTLRARVLGSRDRLTISHAAAQYRAVFQTLAL